MSSNNQLANFKPEGTEVVKLQEWTYFQTKLNKLINFLNGFSAIQTYNVETFASLPMNLKMPAFAWAADTKIYYAWDLTSNTWKTITLT